MVRASPRRGVRIGARDGRGSIGEGTELMDTMMLEVDPELQRIYAWWRDRTGPGMGRLPTLSHIEEIELLNSGCMSLVEVAHDPLRFRYRLVSSELTAHLGYDMSGKPTRAIRSPTMRAYVEQLYERVVQMRAPWHERGELVLDRRRWLHRTLVLPLSAEGSTVDALLVYRRTTPTAPSPPSEEAEQARRSSRY